MKTYKDEEKKNAYRLAEDINTHPGDLDVLSDYRDFLLYKSNVPDGRAAISCSFKEMQEAFAAWSIGGLMKGTKRVIDRAGEPDFMCEVYPEEEILADPEKKDVKIFFFPAQDINAGKKPFVISIAGGAYTSVCSLAESFPTASSMNEAGYNVFALNYRVNISDIGRITESLMPKPMEDIAVALRYILGHREAFGQENEEYIVNGFSAGAGITLFWGTQEFGYAHYGQPKPKALIPVYAPADLSLQNSERRDDLAKVIFGPDVDEETILRHAVPKVMTEDYPPCYLVHAKNDPTVPIENTYAVRDRMEELSIPVFAEIPESGGHGFGDGTGSPAQGWPERALRFIESL